MANAPRQNADKGQPGQDRTSRPNNDDTRSAPQRREEGGRDGEQTPTRHGQGRNDNGGSSPTEPERQAPNEELWSEDEGDDES